MENFSIREQIIEVANKLFIYTDLREWQKLLDEVFTEKILFDMSSAGAGELGNMNAQNVCDIWDKGFEGIDFVHHQAGNYLVALNKDEAAVFAYAIAIHFKNAATQGKTREFVGSYNLYLIQTEKGWRIDAFKYNLKYVKGNFELK